MVTKISKRSLLVKQRKLGSTGVNVSEIGFGTWQLGGISWVSPTEQECVNLLQYAFDQGVNLYDVSPSYGNGRSETLVAKAFPRNRDKVLISGKVGVLEDGTYHGFWSERQLLESLEQSLHRLQTDYLDILSLHAPPMDVLKSGYAIDLLQRLKKKGVVRFIGVSLEAQPTEAIIALQQDIDILQIRFNLLFQEAEQVFQTVAEKNVGLIINSPFAHGYLSGRYRRYEDIADGDYPKGPFRASKPRELVEGMIQAANTFHGKERFGTLSLPQTALSFVLSHPVSSVVPGHRSIEELNDNLAANMRESFSSEDLSRIRRINRDLSQHRQLAIETA
jgi:aryl-alcohol dehydrogenase-like predicted oxidoreductase